jgi:NADH:ubiquinone oxidoreductase subunit 4 (subunit M)
MTVLSAATSLGWWMPVLLVGVVLAAAYNLIAIRRTVQGPVGQATEIADLTATESVTSVGIALLIVVVGLAPWLVTSAASRSIEAIIAVIAKGA